MIKIWVNKIQGNSSSKFGIIVGSEIFDVDDLRRAINKSAEITNMSGQFGHGAAEIFTEVSGTAESLLDVAEPLFENGLLKWKILFFSEPAQKGKNSRNILFVCSHVDKFSFFFFSWC